MADDVHGKLRALHDQLLADQPAGTAHDTAACAFCPSPEPKGAPVSVTATGKVYNEVELQAAITAALGDLRTELDALRQSQEAAAVEERVRTAVAEAVAPLQATLSEAQAALETAKIEAANEKARAEGLEAASAEAARVAEIAGRRDARIAKVKEVANFDDAFIEANGDRWAEMEEAAFDERVAEWAALSKKPASAGPPTTTALTAAVADTGRPPASAGGPGGRTRSPNLKALGELRRSGVDVRHI